MWGIIQTSKLFFFRLFTVNETPSNDIEHLDDKYLLILTPDSIKNIHDCPTLVILLIFDKPST